MCSYDEIGKTRLTPSWKKIISFVRKCLMNYSCKVLGGKTVLLKSDFIDKNW